MVRSLERKQVQARTTGWGLYAGLSGVIWIAQAIFS